MGIIFLEIECHHTTTANYVISHLLSSPLLFTLRLLELKERWKFIYNRLYDEETDTFDLSRIPE